MAQKQNGLYGKMETFFKATPTKMYTYEDIMEEFEVEQQAAQNGVYNLYRVGKIMRHIDKDPDTNIHRYALKINPAKADPYKAMERNSPTGKKKKGQLPSAREMRTAFAQLQNSLANMEDMMIAVVEESEHMEKMLNKIKNITN